MPDHPGDVGGQERDAEIVVDPHPAAPDNDDNDDNNSDNDDDINDDDNDDEEMLEASSDKQRLLWTRT